MCLSITQRVAGTAVHRSPRSNEFSSTSNNAPRDRRPLELPPSKRIGVSGWVRQFRAFKHAVSWEKPAGGCSVEAIGGMSRATI